MHNHLQSLESLHDSLIEKEHQYFADCQHELVQQDHQSFSTLLPQIHEILLEDIQSPTPASRANFQQHDPTEITFNKPAELQ